VAHATGIARSTINRGVNDLEAFESARKVQRADGGRPLLTQTDPMLLEDMQGGIKVEVQQYFQGFGTRLRRSKLLLGF
jgi:hypothetical protein